MNARVKTAQRLLQQAKAMLGPGWNHVSEDIQRALVMERVLVLVLSQDESIDPVTVLRVMRELAAEVDALLQEGKGKKA